MNTYIKMKRKSKKILSEIDELQKYLTLTKDLISKKITKIDEDENLKILKKRIIHQPQLHYEEFTNMEKSILELLSHGLSFEEIAEDYCISINTVKTHVSNMYSKTGIMEPKDKSIATKRVKLILYYLKQIDKLDYDWVIKL